MDSIELGPRLTTPTNIKTMPGYRRSGRDTACRATPATVPDAYKNTPGQEAPRTASWNGRANPGVILAVAILALIPPATSRAEPNEPGDIELSELRIRVSRIGERTNSLAGRDDLLDSLHFGWFDRPYARASLAILVKTTAILEREVRMRQRGNGAIPDSTIRDMLWWAEDALDRVVKWKDDVGFRPHRLNVATADLQSVTSTPALFSFVDRATSTQQRKRIGDLDIAAAIGFRLYARMDREMGTLDAISLRGARAAALGMATVVVRQRAIAYGVPGAASPVGDSANADKAALIVEGLNLGELLELSRARADQSRWSGAVVDPPLGESLGSSLARRALARGVLGRDVYIALGWTPGITDGADEDSTLPIVATMWMQALDGQSVGLLAGWRDLRDGRASPYASVLTSPRRLETIAHTALDVLRLGDNIKAFRSTAPLALVIGKDAVAADDPNAWADWIEPVWSTLLHRQVRFDLVPRSSSKATLRRRYAVVLSLRYQHADDIESFLENIQRSMAGLSPKHRQTTAHELDGRLARNVFVRSGRTKQKRRCVAVVNLSAEPRQLRVDLGKKSGALQDAITEERMDRQAKVISLRPWQTRLLWPTE